MVLVRAQPSFSKEMGGGRGGRGAEGA
eukprot:COSAG01_NODE_45048_length_413_cov_0.691083_2_plen_26_part_01